MNHSRVVDDLHDAKLIHLSQIDAHHVSILYPCLIIVNVACAHCAADVHQLECILVVVII